MTAQIIVLPGDGIGPEVTKEAVNVLRAVARKFGHVFVFEEHPFGGASVDMHGVPITEGTLAACRRSSAILLGAVGGPQWDSRPVDIRPERGLLRLRKELGLYANLRPVRVHPALAGSSPLKEHLLRDIDMVVVRELTGGLYFGKPRFTREEGGTVRSVDTLEYTRTEIARIVDLAFRLASKRKRKVTSVDKANVLDTSRLWRKTATEISASYPGVVLEHMLVDTAAMRLVSAPASFDVVVTENMFGDILTDEASVLAGSMGMLPSASLGDAGPGLFEPIHGSAPDIAGLGVANPVGAILSAAMLLRYSLGKEEEACAVESAVYGTIEAGLRTPDLGGTQTTRQVGARILQGFN